ncbi:MAG: chorismate-binding protein [Prevotella sp.]|nr:chorismate-binding protein [Prevotella sp.]
MSEVNLSQTVAFALYRKPRTRQCMLVKQTAGEPLALAGCTALNGRSGFVVAPFETTSRQPLLLIRPDVVEELSVETFAEGTALAGDSHEAFDADVVPTYSGGNRQTYAIDFANYHAQLQQNQFRKIVLARCADEQLPAGLTPLLLFYRACERYPRMFVSLVYTRQSGLWLMATPEILLEGNGDEWRSIALAGTMKLEGRQLQFDTADAPAGAGNSSDALSLAWSTKNIQEQRIVATYLAECLEQHATSFCEEGPTTVRAANLVHLRSDFSFTLPDSDHLGALLHTLHPTPAVCGLPKHEASSFIGGNEHTSRRYYSGFMGPLLLPDTHLYVSLRCMHIEGRCCHLFAGGGLLKDSTEQQEWMETEAKLETMRGLMEN